MTTNIPISEDLADWLHERKERGQTWDELLREETNYGEVEA